MRARWLELRDEKLDINHRASQIRNEVRRLEAEIVELLYDMSKEGKVDVETRLIRAVILVVWSWRDKSAADRTKKLRELRREHKLGRGLVSRITQLIDSNTIDAQVQADALQNENSIAMLRQAAKDHEASQSPTVWSSESLDGVHRLGCGFHKAISHIIGRKSLGPNSTYLRHWDISENNVMVDSSDQAAALIGWEQIIMVPLDFNSGLPRILGGREHSKPPPWPAGRFKTEDRLKVEEMYENTLCKRAFVQRLRELKSPILDTFGGDSEEMDLLHDVIEDVPGHSYEWYELNMLPVIKKKYEWKI